MFVCKTHNRAKSWCISLLPIHRQKRELFVLDKLVDSIINQTHRGFRAGRDSLLAFSAEPGPRTWWESYPYYCTVPHQNPEASQQISHAGGLWQLLFHHDKAASPIAGPSVAWPASLWPSVLPLQFTACPVPSECNCQSLSACSLLH